jgi:hypothetical protein
MSMPEHIWVRGKERLEILEQIQTALLEEEE